MNNSKLHANSEEQINTLVRTVHVFRSDMGMDFGIKKFGILTRKKCKIVKI